VKVLYLPLLALCFSSFLCGVFLLAFVYLPGGSAPEPVEIKVERGEPLSSVIRKLKQAKVISNKTLFSLWATLTTREKKIQWGLYRFDLPIAPAEILDRMVHGRGVFRRVTIPEGLTVNQTAVVLAQAGIVEQNQFLERAEDPEVLRSLNLEETGIEGYLFPDTYSFVPFVTEKEVLATMVERFRKVFGQAVNQQAEDAALTPHEVVTLASLVEKESALEAERPLVSAVFHNRLRSNMPLQSDPTVIYGIKNFSGNLTRKDLQAHTPHNTYLIQGLPPTPICNPGLSALRAALYPASVPYLYFVSKNDGSHFFSVTMAEHNRAVKIYQNGAQNTR
jgi:peptidoglycan lytic transglycosylase G